MARLESDVEAHAIGLDRVRLGRLERRLEDSFDRGARAGALILIARGGKVGYMHAAGWRDAEARLPVGADTVWRMYSMTKPLTSIAALSLCEEGRLTLDDPVARFIPAFAHARVFDPASTAPDPSRPAREPLRVRHLLTHTSGLTYPSGLGDRVDALYVEKLGQPARFPSLEAFCDALAALPLLFEPGSAWNYSFSTDVLARVAEVAAGMPLDRVLRERVLDPLGMDETGFAPPPDAGDRLAVLYAAQGGSLARAPEREQGYSPFPQGGTGLWSTARDYQRLLEMLRGQGEAGGVRVVAPSTLGLMTANHLPGGVDIPTFARPSLLASTLRGYGFGLGFSVLADPVRAGTISHRGEYGWGGAAGTEFWVDPTEDLTVLFCTQVLGAPDEHPLRRELRWLVYQALVA
jgi:CubicO group peptidase (beta-lactamase class C family)